MTTSQIIAAARRKLLESAVDLITDATLLEYANQAYMDVVKRAFPNATVKTANVVFVSGVGTKPTDFGTIYGDAVYNNAVFYSELSIGDFLRADSYGITVEANQLKIYPAESKTVAVKYYPTYTALASGTVDPSFDSYYDELVIYGILFRAYEDLQDEELSTYYETKYETKFKQKRNSASYYDEGNQRGGQMFNGIQIIS